MAKRALPQPRSIVPKGGYTWAVALTLVFAAGMRLWHLPSLPPGLANGEATLGLAAYALSHHGVWPTYAAASGQAPLFVVLESLMQSLFGLNPWILRILPAIAGTLAVGVTYLWARAWFGRSTGLITAFLLASSPWAITLSRNIQPSAFVPLLLALSLWLGTRLWRRRGWHNLLAFIIVLGLSAYSGIAGWSVVAVTMVVAVIGALYGTERPRKALQAVWLVVGLLAITPAFVLSLLHRPNLGLGGLASLPGQLARTLLAFLVHGDDSYQTNLGGQPLLNVFVGIMLVAGILIVLTRIKRRPNQALAGLFVASLVPAIASAGTSPSAARLSLALLPVLALAALGIGYMLEIWYTTFPINSAARLSGQTAILILLVLSAYQGYTQYFTAWAGSSPTQAAFNETATALATWAKAQPKGDSLVLITTPDTTNVLQYDLLNNTHQTLVVTKASDIPAAVAQRPLRLAAAISYRDQLVAALKAGAAGGTLRSHTSSFDQTELYYTYELP